MLRKVTEAVTVGFLAVLAAATPVINAHPGPGPSHGIISRPHIQPFPHNTGRPRPYSPLRTKSCKVKALGGGKDDAPQILKAFHDCNHGGTVVLDKQYTIGTALDLTFLDRVDIALSGSITFTTDIDYWAGNSFYYTFQNSTSYWKIGGKDVNIYGGGLIDGNGQPWWEAVQTNKTLLRPIALVIDGLKGGSITGFRMINPPNVSEPASIGRALELMRCDSGSILLPTAPTF